MAIEERKIALEPARVLYFDARRGQGKCLTQAGRVLRIPLCAVNAAGVITLDPDDLIYVSIDEHCRTRVERLQLPLTPVDSKEPNWLRPKHVTRKQQNRHS